MKKILALTIALAFFATIPAYVLANDYKNASEFCKDYDDFGEIHGKCVSIMENCFNRGNATPVCVCKVWEILFPTNFYENYDNQGLCISDLVKDDD